MRVLSQPTIKMLISEGPLYQYCERCIRHVEADPQADLAKSFSPRGNGRTSCRDRRRVTRMRRGGGLIIHSMTYGGTNDAPFNSPNLFLAFAVPLATKTHGAAHGDDLGPSPFR